MPGSIQVFGVDALADPIARPSSMIAWLPDEPMLYDKLTAWEYLEFVAGLWGVDAKTARAARRGAAASSSTSGTIATSAPKASRAA